MKLKVKMEKGWYYRNDVWFSKAYRTLSPLARDLLQCFATEVRKKEKKGNWKKKYSEVNNGELSFTESQFRMMSGCSKQSYYNARNQLIETGFIKITYRGGGGSGDRSTYKLFICSDIPEKKQRWRKYPAENWKDEIPKAKDNLVGKKSQWKKGQCGRKLDSTLSDCTLIKDSPPNAVDPNYE